MRSLIYTADISNLETVSIDEEDQSEVRTTLVVPNVEGKHDVNLQTIKMLLDRVAPEQEQPNSRNIVLVTPDLMGCFADDDLANYFDPIELVDDIKQGNFGSVLGMQVVLLRATSSSCLAVAHVQDTDEGVTILDFAAVEVKL